MACCAALTLVFAWVRHMFGWAIPDRDDEFAPAATWPPVDRPVRTALAPRTGRPRAPHERLARAFVVVGIAWFTAGVLAMHVLGVIDPIRSIPADVVFHASGLWLATLGLALRFLPGHTVRSPA